MLELKKGDDILAVVGDITSLAAARALFEKRLDSINLDKLSRITNEEALIKIANAISICNPDSIFINTGSPEDVQWIREYSLKTAEERTTREEGSYHPFRPPGRPGSACQSDVLHH